MALISDIYRKFAPNRSRDTLVGDVQQTNNTPYIIYVWPRQNTRFAGNVPSVVQYSRYAPSTLCIVQSNAQMLPIRERKTERLKKQSMNRWPRRFQTSESFFLFRRPLPFTALNVTHCIVRFVEGRFQLSTLAQSS